jgi:hypothetical protein
MMNIQNVDINNVNNVWDEQKQICLDGDA